MQRIQLAPKTDLSRAFLAVALGHLGEAEEAQRVWQELQEINPKYSFPEHLRRLPFRSPAEADRLTEGLIKAGIDAFSNCPRLLNTVGAPTPLSIPSQHLVNATGTPRNERCAIRSTLEGPQSAHLYKPGAHRY